MANPVGRYVQIAVDTPENIQSFSLVKEIDTSQLILQSGSSFIPETITQGIVQNCKIIHGRLQSDTIAQNQTILDGMGFARKQKEQYTLVTEGSTYNCPMTRDEFCGALNRHFEPVEMGEKPIDWDENKGWKYWEKVLEQTFTDRPYYRIAREPWSATTQYYSNTQDFHYYYIIDGDKKVRVGVGDTGLTHNNGRIGMWIGHKEAGDGKQYTGFNDAFWTFINGETERIIKDGTTSNEYYTSTIGTSEVGAINSLFAGDQMSRYLFNTGYNTGWRSSVTDEQKGQWRTRVHNEVRIKNVTTTQFGFLNHEGHRYFGIWVCYPTAEFYVGYHQYPITGTGTNKKGTGPYTTEISQSDLRTYDFSKPIPDTEIPKWGNVYFYGVELDALDVTLEEKEGIMPPDVNPNPSTGANWQGADKDTFPLRGRNDGILASAARGFKIYKMPNYPLGDGSLVSNDFGAFAALVWNWGSFGNMLWKKFQAGIPPVADTSMIWEAFKDTFSQSKIDPLNAVAFCNIYPSFVANQAGERDVQEISLGGYKITPQDMGLRSLNTYQVLQEVYYTKIDIDCYRFNTGEGYLELAPYSQAEIYLPYIGFIQLDPQDFIGGSIEVYYNCSVFDGAISAQVICTPDIAKGNPIFYGPFIGSACQSIPLTQKDANAFQRTMGVLTAGAQAAGGVMKSLTSTMGNIMTGSLNSPHSVLNQGWSNVETMGAGTSKAVGTLINTMLMPQRLNHGASLPTGSGFVTNNKYIHVFVNTPVPKYAKKEDVSKYGNASGEITTVRGAASAGNTVYCKFKYIDTHKIEATAAEIDAINRYLTGGVYL